MQHKDFRTPPVCWQVTRLGQEDVGFSRRELYMRNLSSRSLDRELDEADDLPEPSRVQGDIIAFRRSVVESGALSASWLEHRDSSMVHPWHPWQCALYAMAVENRCLCMGAQHRCRQVRCRRTGPLAC